MVVPPLLPRSSFQPNNILENEPEEYSGAKVSLVSYLCNMRAGGLEKHLSDNYLCFLSDYPSSIDPHVLCLKNLMPSLFVP